MGTTAKGVPLGLATLDSSARLPAAQLPAGLADVIDFDQAAAVADLGALTASAPAALTASAPAAITSTDAAGATPTDAEFDALRADVIALRATVAAAVVDLAALRTPLAATVTDVAAVRTKLNAGLGSLRTAGIIDT
jgi:hypothetical protein